jgi:hypothetical protein
MGNRFCGAAHFETNNLTSGLEEVRFLAAVILPLDLFQSLFVNLRNARLCRSVKTGKRVRIPRCRATVSEEKAVVHWDGMNPGKGEGGSGC